MIQKFVEILRQKIRDDLNNYADDIAGGACQNFEQYQKTLRGHPRSSHRRVVPFRPC
jgi:hypothetical protein